jgi:hypothetical protein
VLLHLFVHAFAAGKVDDVSCCANSVGNDHAPVIIEASKVAEGLFCERVQHDRLQDFGPSGFRWPGPSPQRIHVQHIDPLLQLWAVTARVQLGDIYHIKPC